MKRVKAVDYYGPNGIEVSRFIERASRLTEPEVFGMQVDFGGDMHDAITAVWFATAASGRKVERSMARCASRGPTADSEILCAEVASALVVRDLITKEQFEAVVEKWASVAGRTWEESA
jgi:hypothetical protein